MDVRRDIRKQLLVAQSIIRHPVGLSPEYHDSLVVKLEQLMKKLQHATCVCDADLVTSRRKELSENVPLYDIFTTLWHLVSENCPEGFVTKEAYFVFHRKMQIALIGSGNSAFDKDFDNLLAELDWASDNVCFGVLYRVPFYDLLFELVETWSTVLSSKYYAAFSWALLDSVADLSKFPPRFRANGDIQCLMKCSNMSDILENFQKSSKQRVQLAITAEYMQRVPEIQKRVRSRREGVSLDRSQTDMVAIVGQKEERQRQRQLQLQQEAYSKDQKGKKGPVMTQRLSRRFSNMSSIYDEPAAPGTATTEELCPVTEDEELEAAQGPLSPAPRLVAPGKQKSVNRSGFGSSVLRGQSERSLHGARSESSLGSKSAAPAAPASDTQLRALEGHKQGLWTPGMLDEAVDPEEERAAGATVASAPVVAAVAEPRAGSAGEEHLFLASFLDDVARKNLTKVEDAELLSAEVAGASNAAGASLERTRRQSLATPAVMRRMTLLSKTASEPSGLTVAALTMTTASNSSAVNATTTTGSTNAVLARARRQSISTHTSYRERAVEPESQLEDLADSPRDEVFLDWEDNVSVFGLPGALFRSGLGSNNQSPVAFERTCSRSSPTRSPDSLVKAMYTTLSAPALIPAYPRRDTARVNIAMLHERDAILLPVDASRVPEHALDPLAAPGSNSRPGSPSRRGVSAGEAVCVRKAKSEHSREEYTQQFRGKDATLLGRALSMPGQFDPTPEAMTLFSTTPKPLVLDNRVPARALRNNYALAQRAASPPGGQLQTNTNLAAHSSSVLELTSDLGLDALNLQPDSGGAWPLRGQDMDDECDGDSSTTQVGDQADITRSVIDATAMRVSAPHSPTGSRPHSPKLFEVKSVVRPATSGGSVFNHSIAKRAGKHVYKNHPSNRAGGNEGRKSVRDTNAVFFESIDRKLRKLSRVKTIGDRPREAFRHVPSSLNRLAASAQASFVPSLQYDASMQMGPQSKPPPEGKFERNEGVEVWRAETMDDTLGEDDPDLALQLAQLSQDMGSMVLPGAQPEGARSGDCEEEGAAAAGRPHTASEAEARAVSFSAVVSPVSAVSRPRIGVKGKSLRELAGIDQMREEAAQKRAVDPEAVPPSALFTQASQAVEEYAPSGRPSLFATRLRALRAQKDAQAARPTTAPAHLSSPGASVGEDLMTDSVATGGSVVSLASTAGGRSAVSTGSSVRTFTNFTGNVSALPEGAIVHQPGLVVSSRYSTGPVNLDDDFRSPPGKSGSALRTYDQTLSDSVPALILHSPSSPQRLLSGLEDLSLDLQLGASVSVLETAPLRKGLAQKQGQTKGEQAQGQPQGRTVASAGTGRSQNGQTQNGQQTQQEQTQQGQRANRLQSTSEMLKRLMSRAKERKQPPKPAVSFVQNPKPWVPECARQVAEHDRSNQTLGYNDHILIRKHELDGTLFDTTLQNQVVRQQNRIKSSFEQYAQEKIERSHRHMAVSSAPLMASAKKVPMNKGPKRI